MSQAPEHRSGPVEPLRDPGILTDAVIAKAISQATERTEHTRALIGQLERRLAADMEEKELLVKIQQLRSGAGARDLQPVESSAPAWAGARDEPLPQTVPAPAEPVAPRIDVADAPTPIYEPADLPPLMTKVHPLDREEPRPVVLEEELLDDSP